MENKKYYCPRCKKEVKLKMFADHSSSGLWCDECGINFEGIDLLSKELIEMICLWIFNYEVLDRNKEYQREYIIKLFNSVGRHLCSEVNKTFECQYIDEDFGYSPTK